MMTWLSADSDWKREEMVGDLPFDFFIFLVRPPPKAVYQFLKKSAI